MIVKPMYNNDRAIGKFCSVLIEISKQRFTNTNCGYV